MGDVHDSSGRQYGTICGDIEKLRNPFEIAVFDYFLPPSIRDGRVLTCRFILNKTNRIVASIA